MSKTNDFWAASMFADIYATDSDYRKGGYILLQENIIDHKNDDHIIKDIEKKFFDDKVDCSTNM